MKCTVREILEYTVDSIRSLRMETDFDLMIENYQSTWALLSFRRFPCRISFVQKRFEYKWIFTMLCTVYCHFATDSSVKREREKKRQGARPILSCQPLYIWGGIWLVENSRSTSGVIHIWSWDLCVGRGSFYCGWCQIWTYFMMTVILGKNVGNLCKAEIVYPKHSMTSEMMKWKSRARRSV